MSQSSSLRGSDPTARALYKKIHVIENGFKQAAEALTVIQRTETKMAARRIGFAQQLQLYGEEETPGVRRALATMAASINRIEEHRQTRTNQMEGHVLDVLQSYEAKCKAAKHEVSERERLKEKLVHRQKALERVQTREPLNTAKINHAKVDLAGANSECAQADQTMLDNMIRFEREKLNNLKAMLTEMIVGDMNFHARSLEVLTAAHEAISFINTDVDLRDMLVINVDPQHQQHMQPQQQQQQQLPPAHLQQQQQQQQQQYAGMARPGSSQAPFGYNPTSSMTQPTNQMFF